MSGCVIPAQVFFVIPANTFSSSLRRFLSSLRRQGSTSWGFNTIIYCLVTAFAGMTKRLMPFDSPSDTSFQSSDCAGFSSSLRRFFVIPAEVFRHLLRRFLSSLRRQGSTSWGFNTIIYCLIPAFAGMTKRLMPFDSPSDTSFQSSARE